MKFLSMVIVAISCVILTNAMSIELISPFQSEPTEEQQSETFNAGASQLKSDPDTNFKAAVTTINTSTNNTDFVKKNFDYIEANSHPTQNLKIVLGKISKNQNLHSKKSLGIVNKKSTIVQKNLKSEMYQVENIATPVPIKSDNLANKIPHLPNEVERSLLTTSEELPFSNTWPKYVEHSFKPVLPFAELYSDKYFEPLNVDLFEKQQEQIKSSEVKVIGVPSEHTAMPISLEAQEIRLEPHDLSPSKSTLQLPEINTEDKHQQMHKSTTQLETVDDPSTGNKPSTSGRHLYESSPMHELHHSSKTNLPALEESDLVGIMDSNSTEDINGPGARSYPEKSRQVAAAADSLVHHRRISPEFETENKPLPWDLRKFVPIAPFSELSETWIARRIDDGNLEKISAGDKTPFLFNQEQRTPETAGPVLHPQSSFIREFQVPFY